MNASSRIRLEESARMISNESSDHNKLRECVAVGIGFHHAGHHYIFILYRVLPGGPQWSEKEKYVHRAEVWHLIIFLLSDGLTLQFLGKSSDKCKFFEVGVSF